MAQSEIDDGKSAPRSTWPTRSPTHQQHEIDTMKGILETSAWQP